MSVTETYHAAEFLLSEASGQRSREAVTVLSGQDLAAGAVCGRVTMAVGKAAIPTVVGDGDGVMSGLFAGPKVQEGAYVLTCTAIAENAGTFSVVNPSGKALPSATVAVAYTSDEINFTIADGSTDFAVGDVFTITVGTGAPAVVGTGNGTLSSISLGPDAKTGRYQFVCREAVTNGGKFELMGPDGASVAFRSITAGAGGTAVFANRQLNATITDGSTDFAVGDHFEVFVYNKTTKKVVAWDATPTAYDGRHIPAGILYAAVDASTADAAGVLVARDAEVDADALSWITGTTAAEKANALQRMAAELRIVVR